MIILLNFVFEISDYVFSRRGNTNFPFGTPRQYLRPTPLPPGLSGIVLGTDMNILYLVNCEMYQTQCDLSAEVLLDLE